LEWKFEHSDFSDKYPAYGFGRYENIYAPTYEYVPEREPLNERRERANRSVRETFGDFHSQRHGYVIVTRIAPNAVPTVRDENT